MRVMQDLDIAEKTGHGNVLIVSKYGKDAFDIQDNYINVTIPFNEDVIKNHGTINGIINGTISDNLTANESIVISILISNPASTTNSLVETTGLSKRTIARILASLQDKKIIERIGSNKTGKWKVIK